MSLPSCTIDDRRSVVVERRFSRSAAIYGTEASVQTEVAAVTSELVLEAGSASEKFLPQRILEVGCGTGFLTQRLAHRFPKSDYIACDLSAAMIARARAALPLESPVTFLRGDFLALDALAPVDLLVSSSTFQWIRPLQLLKEKVATLVLPGGVCVFSAFVDGTLRELRELRAALFPEKALRERLHSGAEYLRLLHDAGFEVQRHTEQDFILRSPSARELFTRLNRLGFSACSHRDRTTSLSREELRELSDKYQSLYAMQSGGVQATFRSCFFVAKRRSR